MRKTSGILNDKEFIKIKPDLRKNAVRGIVTAEVIDSKSGEVVHSCQSENVITDAFYRYAAAFFAEDFINTTRNVSSGNSVDRAFFGGGRSDNGDRSRAFGIMTLSKTNLTESEKQRFVGGEIAGTVVVTNNVSRGEVWAGNLMNPQDVPIIDEYNVSSEVEYQKKPYFTRLFKDFIIQTFG